MKICFVVPGFSADEADWCIPAHTDIVRALAETHEVHVFTMRYPHRVDTYRIGNATVHSFNGVGSRGVTTGQLWTRVLRAIRREHHGARFDVIHAIFGSEAGGVAVLAGKWLGVPSLVWLVNGELVGLPDIGYGAELYPRQRWMNQLILRYAGEVLCGCEGLADAARQRIGGGRKERIQILPLGVNLERFPARARLLRGDAASLTAVATRNDRPAHFVNVGSLVPVKDQMLLLRAFARVVEVLPGARLTIAGQGPLEAELGALAAELKLAASVTFAGNVPHDRLAALYQGADVFVQSSRHEGEGMALLEAGACGAALAGTNVGALADLAREDAAVAVAPFDGGGQTPTATPGEIPEARAAALATAMLKAYAERSERGARASRIIESEYNLDHIRARLEATYKSARQD